MKFKNQNIFDAFINAICGILTLWEEEAARRATVLFLFSLLIFLFKPSLTSFVFIVLSGVVLAFEAVNTAIEKLCDKVENGFDRTIGKVKDLSAGAVFVIVFLAASSGFVAIMSDVTHSNVLHPKLMLIRQILISNYGHYLFFTACTCASMGLAQRKRFFSAFCFMVVSLCWLIFYSSVSKLLNKLGSDSLIELTNVDLVEAFFWLGTLTSSIKATFSYKIFLLYGVFSSIVFLILKLLCSHISNEFLSKLFFWFVLFLIASAGIFLTLKYTLSEFVKTSVTYQNLEKNFSNDDFPKLITDGKEVDVVVLIGESTSAMNMGLYGYPRDTTPGLSSLFRNNNEQRMMLFHNVYSTHSHTSPSLLEALSFGVHSDEKYLPIFERKRIAIPSLIKPFVTTKLFSNQGSSGSYNRASQVIFKDAETNFSRSVDQLNLAGNFEDRIARPYDSDYFQSLNFDEILEESGAEKNLLFLHLYTGHGPYLANVPSHLRKKVDSAFSEYSKEAIVGKINADIGYEDYDTAIKYIDKTVAELAVKILARKKPTIFIFFSDHGESVYTDKGHDSSRFVHEMLRVPLVVAFNDSASFLYSKKLKLYNARAKSRNIITLSQLPSTILELLGLQVISDSEHEIIQEKPIGVKQEIAPVFVRRTREDVKYINLNNFPLKGVPNNTNELNDGISKIAVATDFLKNKKPKTCFHRANTFAKALRGSMVADCLEIDLVVTNKNELLVFHPPAKNTGLDINLILKLAKNKKSSIWIDGKNIENPKNCLVLSEKIVAADMGHHILVEFPSYSHHHSLDLKGCVSKLISSGAATSYYVPTDLLLACSKELEISESNLLQESCKRLSLDLEAALNSELYTDYSFDFSGEKAMKTLQSTSQLKWNSWHVPLAEIGNINGEMYRLLIFDNNDPNSM